MSQTIRRYFSGKLLLTITLTASAVFLCIVGIGCRKETDVGNTKTSNGLEFRIRRLDGSRYLDVIFESSEYDRIAFPTADPAEVTHGSNRWTLAGKEISTQRVDKRRVWDFQDIAVLQSGTTVTFEILAPDAGQVAIDVPDAYSRDVIEYCASNRILAWTGTVKLDQN